MVDGNVCGDLPGKDELLRKEIEHIDITEFDSTSLIGGFRHMAFQARNLARAAEIFDMMIGDEECSIILCLAGSLFSAGLKKVVLDMVRYNMVDAIVSTGAIIVDQDFFEALGFKHYKGTPFADDDHLRKLRIDRIYDTFIDEDQLRECDMAVARIADELAPNVYSSREFIFEMGRYLAELGGVSSSVVLECFNRKVPVFVPAFSDSSAGFGLVYHRNARGKEDGVAIDSVEDFLELTKIKMSSQETGLVMVGGGVPKNFAQDVVIAADILSGECPMHKYAVQITVADVRDGALSGSTLKEANSWGKVDSGLEQMVFCEATIALPLMASYVYHSGNWKKRKKKEYNDMLEEMAE